MKTIKKTFLLVLIILLTFSIYSCKKYDDGPLVSLRLKEQRLQGEWEVVKLDRFGTNLLSYQYTVAIGDLRVNVVENWKVFIEVAIEGDYKMKYILRKTIKITDIDGMLISEEEENESSFNDGIWELSKGKESINFHINDPQASELRNLINVDTDIRDFGVKISRLTNKEFNFMDDYRNQWKLEKK